MGAGQKTFSLFNWVISWIVTLDRNALALLHFRIRKVMHVLCYGVMSILWFRALMASYPNRLNANLVLALGLCLAVSAADESSQFLSASRTGSLWDVGLDMTGGVLFLFSTFFYWKRRNMTPFGIRTPLS
jgi:VanZ family protein